MAANYNLRPQQSCKGRLSGRVDKVEMELLSTRIFTIAQINNLYYKVTVGWVEQNLQ